VATGIHQLPALSLAPVQPPAPQQLPGSSRSSSTVSCCCPGSSGVCRGPGSYSSLG